MRYYIADLHFCHSNLNQRMDHRGFESGEAMNEYMIKQWNSRVRNGDEVVILGDFCLSRDIAEVNRILGRLMGKKYLIIGNHDRYLEKKGFDRSQFKWIEHYKELNDNKRKIILSHYPIMCYNGQYRRNGIPCQMINCFCMFSDYVPLTLDEWIQLDKKRRVKISISDYEAVEEMDDEE